jgi:uncharacterized protein (TIGR03118 family)
MLRILRHAVGPMLALSMIGTAASGQHYTQTNLVANSSAGGAATTDANLVNPWGMSRSSSSPWWVSDNVTGVSTLYEGNGTKAPITVTIPAAKSGAKGSPTGTIYNGSKTDFLLAAGTPAHFLFSTLDGMIVGWNNSTMGPVAEVKTTDGSAYTGMTSAMVDGHLYLYAANFTKGTVDVYDNAFHLVGRSSAGHHYGEDAQGEDRGDDHNGGGYFSDDRMPTGYAPFNVQAIGDDIVVTYARSTANQAGDFYGPGLGYVDIYSSGGQLLTRLEHGSWMNGPWGVALAPLDFGAFSHSLLIAQFAGAGSTQSSGTIAAFDLATGAFKGQLLDASGSPLAINGIWAISPGNASPSNFDSAGAPSSELYFTAGINNQAGGLLGYLTAVSTDMIQGNDQ